MSTEKKPHHIIRLEAENVKRLSAVTITPKGRVVIIGGNNTQGKTSVLDCIEMAFGGKNAIPPDPVRHGERTARIIAETDDLIVTRKFKKGLGSTIEVTNKDGAKLSSPQTILDRLTTSLAFDPLAFVRDGGTPDGRRRQLVKLRELAGVDTTEVDQKRKVKYDERTEMNRRVESQRAIVEQLPRVGPERVDVTKLLAEVEEAEAHNRKGAQHAEDREASARAADAQYRRAAEIQKRIVTYEEQIAQIKERIAAEENEMAMAQKEGKEYDEKAKAAAEAIKKFEPRGTADLREQIANAGTINAEADKFERRKDEADNLRELERKAETLTDEIRRLDEQREKMVAAGSLPVDGLGFGEDGVTFNDVPLEQASSAEQLRVGVAVACAMNPQLRVMLIRDGSLLDDKSLAIVAEVAERYDAQVWVERVGKADKSAVIIEDGMVEREPEGELQLEGAAP